MLRTMAFLVSVVCIFSVAAAGQCMLSANSGINSADTCVAMDLTVTGSATVNLPNPFYNPATQTTSSVLTVAPSAPTLHIEAGYDSSGGLVMNFWPTGAPVNPNASDAQAIGFIRFAGGQITVFAQNGTPLSAVLPAGVSNAWPLNLLGSNPGASVIGNLVVPNIQNYATAIKASLTMSQSPTAAYVGPPAKTGGTTTWTYVPSGSNWIAQQIVLSPALSNGTASRTIQFANMTWHDNASNDAARTARGYTAQPTPVPTISNPNGLTATSPSSTPAIVTQLGGTQNVVFQHGIFSSSDAWSRMTNWLNQDFRFGTEVVPSLSSTNSLSSQGTALVSQINSAGGNNYILIGHSQGGLVSRYAAQYFQSNPPNKVFGAVTLDTPHQGAPIAVTGGPTILAGLSLLSDYLWGVTGCVTPQDNFVCYMAAGIFVSAPLVADGWYSNLPAIVDLTPGSTFLNQLNQNTENFARAGIVSNTPLRWNETRIADDFLHSLLSKVLGPTDCYPETSCGERAFATDTDIVYDEVTALFYFCLFEELIDPDNADYWDYYATYYFNIVIAMDEVDAFWNIIVSGGSASDGFVPASSQNYPSSSAIQYPIYGADSHTGATTSPYVRSTLEQLLKSFPFNVPTQASCTFADSPTSYSVSGNGGSGSFSLTTGAGCKWSAVSQAPWLSVTSGSSGTSSGSISFSVAANPVTIPRTGTIQVGNGGATASFTATEAGVCTYSLTASDIVIQPGGGNFTTSVGTGTGCVWSAVSNAPWLTITAGASGTGPGSFTLTASPNPGDTDLVGTITVMNQTLQVTLGDPAGSPGTGSVTINGQEHMCSYTSYPSCYENIWESGTVMVTVGGLVFTVSYSGNENASSGAIASTLAQYMNYQDSPLTATVSGSTVTIKSSINGAATNYSLSTSYTYDTTNFLSPAFTAYPSGASLTGGTN